MNPMPDFALVYQCGLANVFEVTPLRRWYQDSFGHCEAFCQGLLAAGQSVGVYHCDQAGDIQDQDWDDGPGEMFAESKHPPR